MLAKQHEMTWCMPKVFLAGYDLAIKKNEYCLARTWEAHEYKSTKSDLHIPHTVLFPP